MRVSLNVSSHWYTSLIPTESYSLPDDYSHLDSKWPHWPMSAFVALLILVEIVQIQQNYRAIEMFAPNDAKLQIAVGWLAWAHSARIALISTFFLKWRWALWVAAATYILPYIPNPWVTGTIMNSWASLFIFAPLAFLALRFAPQYVSPWRRQNVGGESGTGDS